MTTLCRVVMLLCCVGVGGIASAGEKPLELGNRRELLVDRHLIDRLDNARHVLHAPKDEGVAVQFDKPWEGKFCGYVTVIRDGDTYRLYYRGKPSAVRDGKDEYTCYAESRDGITWTKPKLELVEEEGSKSNNILMRGAPECHNFSPFLDRRPGVSSDARYKALGGTKAGGGLMAFASADGVHWRLLQEEPVITRGAFDSQNVAFWSEPEQCYVAYFRIFTQTKDEKGKTIGVRSVSRATSPDFVHWSKPVRMTFDPPQTEHLYTNQTHPYFRAPHLYVATAARFMPGRQILTKEEATKAGVHPHYFGDCSDAVLLTSRNGTRYDRTFPEGFLRPGVGPRNWISRTNYPALNIVQTGPNEMSLYVNQDYAQPTAHLRRYSMRLDGLASVQAPYEGGEMITKPLTFEGDRLLLNFATSAAGGVRVEIQDAAGNPIPGFTLEDSRELIGNEIERAASWKNGSDVSSLAGKPIRLRFVMKDADLYALRFAKN